MAHSDPTDEPGKNRRDGPHRPTGNKTQPRPPEEFHGDGEEDRRSGQSGNRPTGQALPGRQPGSRAGKSGDDRHETQVAASSSAGEQSRQISQGGDQPTGHVRPGDDWQASQVAAIAEGLRPADPLSSSAG